MGQSTTKKLRQLSRQTSIKPQVILRFDNIPYLFGALPIDEIMRFDSGHFFDEGKFFDTPVRSKFSKDLISVNGTTSRVSKQINVDKGGAGSIQSYRFRIVDKNKEASQILKNGNYVPSLKGQRCEVFLSLKGGAFPEDAISLMRAYVDEFNSGAGFVEISVKHTDGLRDQDIFNKTSSNLTATIDDVATTIPVANGEKFKLGQDAVTSYIRIDDEFMKIQSIDGNDITVQRGALGSIEEGYDSDADVESTYTLEGNSIDLALKLMLSGADEKTIAEDKNFVQIGVGLSLSNAVFFQGSIAKYNLIQDDLITIEDGANAGSYRITRIVTVSNGQYIQLENTNGSIPVFTPEISSNAVITYKSQYNVLPDGLGMLPDEVDVVEFERQRDLFGSGLTDMLFYLKDEIRAKEFIDMELMRPYGLYTVPRNGKVSVRFTAPPLSSEDTIILNRDNVQNPSDLILRNSTSKFHYNSVVYKYNESIVDDRFLNTAIVFDSDSFIGYNVGRKQMLIESKGLRRSTESEQLTQRQGQRYLDRYKDGARLLGGVGVLFKDAFNLEVGDTVIVDGESLQIMDTKTGKFLTPTFFEIISMDYEIFSARFTFDLLETGASINARFGVFSQASFIESGTTTEIRVKPSFLFEEFDSELDKWRSQIGKNIRIRSEDYSFDETVSLLGVDESKGNALNISELSSAPQEDYLVELPLYDDSDDAQKLRYTYNQRAASIVAINVDSNAKKFEVDDSNGLIVGQIVDLFDPEEYSHEILDIEILAIDGNFITVDKDITLSGNENDHIIPQSFIDGGQTYRYY